MKKVLSIFTALLVFYSINIPVNAAQGDIVVFENASLKASVNRSLGREDLNADVTESEIEKIEYIAIDSNIDSLLGIEKAVNLTRIDWRDTDINGKSKISFDSLVGLPNLVGMSMSEDIDLLEVKKVVQLTELVIISDDEMDLSELRNMPNIKLLNLIGNTHNDFNFNASISHLVNLEELYLQNINFSTNPDLSELISLKTLRFFNTNIHDLSTLNTISPLTSIYLFDNEKLLNLDVLTKFDRLEVLFISGASVKSIEFLREMNLEKMQFLTLDRIGLTDISIVKDLNTPALIKLGLQSNAIVDFSPLAKYEGTGIKVIAMGQKLKLDPIEIGNTTEINLVDHLGTKLPLARGPENNSETKVYGTFKEVANGFVWSDITPIGDITYNTLSANNYMNNTDPDIEIGITVSQEVTAKNSVKPIEKIVAPNTGDNTNKELMLIFMSFLIGIIIFLKNKSFFGK